MRASRAWQQPGRSTIVPTGETTSPHAAVYANAALSMAYDYDDYLFLGHTGHSAVCPPARSVMLGVGTSIGSVR